jgi:putative hemolysin
MKKLFLSAFVLIGIQAHAGGGSSIGPANPASVNCEKLGGKLELVDDINGQYGMCHIEEWTLFSEMSARGLVKEHHYGNVGMPNPASVNCEDIGGAIQIMQEPAGETGICVIEEWTLFRTIDVTAEIE